MVIGSDLIYSDKDKPDLLYTMEELAKVNENLTIIMAYTFHKPTDKKFFSLAKEKWDIAHIPLEELDEDIQANDIGIVIMRYKK